MVEDFYQFICVYGRFLAEHLSKFGLTVGFIEQFLEGLLVYLLVVSYYALKYCFVIVFILAKGLFDEFRVEAFLFCHLHK